MANAAKLLAGNPARILLVGYPGAGKSGTLAQLANAGMNLRVESFDKAGNAQTILSHLDAGGLQRTDIVMLEDKLRLGAKVIEVEGIPEAYATGIRLLDRWKYPNGDGTDTDLGSSKTWGLDTTVVLDTITSLSDAALRRSRSMQNQTLLSTTDRTYNVAMAEVDAFLERFVSSANRHHSIAITHLAIKGPRDLRKGEDDLTAALKRDAAKIVPTRLWPSALGWQLPQQIGRHFSTILLVEPRVRQGKVTHVLKTQSDLELDLRIAAPNFPAEVVVEDGGMLKVFDAVSPGWRDAIKAR